MDKINVILDVDTGMDDAAAIVIAALSKKLNLLGITVCHGNQPLEYTLENTLRVVEMLGKDIPVYAGCPEPMVQRLYAGRLNNIRKQKVRKIIDGKEITIHDRELNLPKAKISPESTHACTFIIETLKNAKEKVTLIPIGPLTNIGMALRMDPSIKDNIEEIVLMGGGIDVGNRTPVAEANFYDDPEAAQIVLSSGCKLRLITLEATETVLISREDAQMFRCSREGNFVADVIEKYIHNLQLLSISGDGKVAVHDATAVCAVIEPSIITDIRRKNCDVDFGGGFADGQLLVDNRTFIKPDSQTFVAYATDREKCIEIMKNTICINQTMFNKDV